MSNRSKRPRTPSRTPKNRWQLQDAKARFSELVDRALSDGPQIVTRHGEETAVVVSAKQWAELSKPNEFSIKHWLMAPEARTDNLVPKQRRPLMSLRGRVKFD
jgi:antitoxin Phd